VSQGLVEKFCADLASRPGPLDVLELGTLRWGSEPTHHVAWLPQGTNHVRSDVEEGHDVDVATDAHDLAAFDDESFDAVIACSVWEHLERPWIAAKAVARVLRPGGVAFIVTHQSFPLHGYPRDYFRFSTEAMAIIFGDAGLVDHVAEYEHKAWLTPPPAITVWDPTAPVWLNVGILAYKPS
jgi:SAM-dependent methyltransferase